MARDPADRFESAGALAAELQAWLDSVKRQEEARTVVAHAKGKGPEAAALRAQAATLRTEAAALLKDVADWQPEEDKLPGWEEEKMQPRRWRNWPSWPNSKKSPSFVARSPMRPICRRPMRP